MCYTCICWSLRHLIVYYNIVIISFSGFGLLERALTRRTILQISEFLYYLFNNVTVYEFVCRHRGLAPRRSRSYATVIPEYCMQAQCVENFNRIISGVLIQV